MGSMTKTFYWKRLLASVLKLENKRDVIVVVVTLYTNPTMDGFYSRVNTGFKLKMEKIVVPGTLMVFFLFIITKNIIQEQSKQKSDAIQPHHIEDCKIYNIFNI